MLEKRSLLCDSLDEDERGTDAFYGGKRPNADESVAERVCAYARFSWAKLGSSTGRFGDRLG